MRRCRASCPWTVSVRPAAWTSARRNSEASHTAVSGGTGGQRPGGSWCSARRATGPGPPGPAGGFLSFGGAPRDQLRGQRVPGPRRHAGAPGPRWSPRSRSSSSLRLHRTQPAAGPRSSPRSRPATSGDAGYRRSSYPVLTRQVSPRAAGPGPEQDPVDHHPAIIPPVPPARHQRASSAPAAAIPHPSGRADPGDHSPAPIYTNQSPRSSGHALVETDRPKVPPA